MKRKAGARIVGYVLQSVMLLAAAASGVVVTILLELLLSLQIVQLVVHVYR